MTPALVVLGAGGDLTRRYLLPALARLQHVGALPDHFAFVGVARDGWDTDRYRQRASGWLAHHAGDIPDASREALLKNVTFVRADVTDPEHLAAAFPPDRGPAVAYLALPPSVFAPAIEALGRVGLPAGSRIVIEKPFGADLASAQRLNRLLHSVFPEGAIFRVDHFLAKQTVQNILGLRFANRVFEPVWSRQHIERVELIWDETLALEGRSSYYDQAGALRDMLQNHLLQLLCLVGMEAPLTLDARDLRDRKVDVLRAVRRPTPAEVERDTVRGRYCTGRIAGRAMPAYVDEPGVDPRRGTETFAQITLWIDNWRWAGVPFVLRTGKALGRDRREIAIHFQPVPHLAFGQPVEPATNALRLMLDPDRVLLGLNVNGPGDPFCLEHVWLERELTPQDVPAYARLLLDVFEGAATLSIRDDQVEESWRVVEPILAAWGAGASPLREYPAGSNGPLDDARTLDDRVKRGEAKSP